MEIAAIGKTVARIEESPTDPKYHYGRDDTILIHFTDGTALLVSGSSYEEVSLYDNDLTAEEVRQWQRAAQGRREAERLTRLERSAWDALSDEERAAKLAARRAKMHPFAREMEDTLGGLAHDLAPAMNRAVFG